MGAARWRIRPATRMGIAVVVASFSAALLAAAVLPGSARGAVTIGSDLSEVPDSSTGCGGAPCTQSQASLPGRLTASPVDGVVVRWRTEFSGPSTARLRVFDPAAGFLFEASSATEDVSTALATFDTRLPIDAGDRIGLDWVGGGSGNPIGVAGTGPTYDHWQPPPADGAAVAPTFAGLPGLELFFNADVEPDCDGDEFGDETQDPSVSCPEPTAPVVVIPADVVVIPEDRCPPLRAELKKAKKKLKAAKRADKPTKKKRKKVRKLRRELRDLGC